MTVHLFSSQHWSYRKVYTKCGTHVPYDNTTYKKSFKQSPKKEYTTSHKKVSCRECLRLWILKQKEKIAEAEDRLGTLT